MPNKFLVQRSRELRKRMTLAEKILWLFLRSSNFAGLRFRRQHPVGRYIVDFYCFQKRLIIELDGEYHHTIKREDIDRDNFLKQHGFHVLHFTNEHIFDHLEQTFQTIANELSLDWQKKDFDCMKNIKFSRKLRSFLLGIRKYQEQNNFCKQEQISEDGKE